MNFIRVRCLRTWSQYKTGYRRNYWSIEKS